MIILRKRLVFWLIKEYFRKWRKIIFFSFVVGLFVFFTLFALLGYFIPKIPVGKKESIGIVGAYTIDTLPSVIQQQLSFGLTRIGKDGKILPGAAQSWETPDNGKTYIFYLRKNIYFSDGTNLTSDNVQYNFSDAKIKKPNKYTLVFELKEKYSPFLITVSRPLFKPDFIGLGDYKIKDIKVNGNFIESLVLVSTKDSLTTVTYQFYPNIETLKTAYMLGEITTATGLPDLLYKDISFSTFPNIKVEKQINYSQLVTLFYNIQDSTLSDKRIRSALSYAIPDEFAFGKRNYTPFSPQSWMYTDQYLYNQDLENAKSLIEVSNTASNGASLILSLKTLPKYKDTAEIIKQSWEKIGVKTKIEVVDSIPSQFQVFLGDFFLPKDPDQYMLWHKGEQNNITRYDNQRIDKLLEDGRKVVDVEERFKIYSDFQKYLLADAPATFLYFPYEYTIKRK